MDARTDRKVDLEQEEALLDAVEKWLQRDVRPHVLKFDHADEYPTEMVEQMKDSDCSAQRSSEEYGGLGLSATTYAKIVEKVAETWMSLSGIFNSHLIMAACVQRAGTPEQKSYYLPKFATGEIRGGLALTEPDAGTDLQGIRTRASRDGNGYVINGTKTWISNGIYGHVFCVAGEDRSRGKAAPQGHVVFHRREGARIHGFKEDREAGLQGNRLALSSFSITTRSPATSWSAARG